MTLQDDLKEDAIFRELKSYMFLYVPDIFSQELQLVYLIVYILFM